MAVWIVMLVCGFLVGLVVGVHIQQKKDEVDLEIAGNMKNYWIERSDHAE